MPVRGSVIFKIYIYVTALSLTTVCIFIGPSPTCIGSAAAVGAGRGRAVPGLHLQGVGALLLPVEHLLGEHLARLGVDLERVLALVPDAVHDVVVHLVVGEGAILVDSINPEKNNILRLCAKILETDICPRRGECPWWLVTS